MHQLDTFWRGDWGAGGIPRVLPWTIGRTPTDTNPTMIVSIAYYDTLPVLHPGSSAKSLSKTHFLKVHAMLDLIWHFLLTCYPNITGRARIISTVYGLWPPVALLLWFPVVTFPPPDFFPVSLFLHIHFHLLLCCLHTRRLFLQPELKNWLWLGWMDLREGWSKKQQLWIMGGQPFPCSCTVSPRSIEVPMAFWFHIYKNIPMKLLFGVS